MEGREKVIDTSTGLSTATSKRHATTKKPQRRTTMQSAGSGPAVPGLRTRRGPRDPWGRACKRAGES